MPERPPGGWAAGGDIKQTPGCLILRRGLAPGAGKHKGGLKNHSFFVFVVVVVGLGRLPPLALLEHLGLSWSVCCGQSRASGPEPAMPRGHPELLWQIKATEQGEVGG